MCVLSLCGKLSEEIDFDVRKKNFDEKKIKRSISPQRFNARILNVEIA